MRFGSVCSGIEAASVAWHPLGWRAAWVAEIEAFPSAVLAHHYPDVPNLGDMTNLPESIVMGHVEAPDVFCGGTPCQAFSVAGLRKSLDDARGNLSLTFCEIANAIDISRAHDNLDPCIVFWENVPGVLNTKDNAFGCFLAGLAGEDDALVAPGGRWSDAGCVLGPQRAVAWRILDAQHFGLAQRRRRVFVVASAREGFDPAAVLFERESLRGNLAPSREARQVAPTIPARSTGGGGLGTDFDCDGGVIVPPIAETLIASDHKGPGHNRDHNFVAHSLTASRSSTQCPNEDTTLVAHVAHSLRGEGFDASEDGTGRGTPPVPVAFSIMPMNSGRDYKARETDVAQPLMAGGPVGGNQGGDSYNSVAVGTDCFNGGITGDVAATMGTRGSSQNASGPTVLQFMQVRRLTPVECERLQGFPDDYTAIPWRGKPASECPDGPRYKALGNSWAVPCVRWIGWRIAAQVYGELA